MSSVFVLVMALVFIWYGIKFVQFGWDQTSELADLPMAWIFVAWPLAGFTWVLFLGERFVARPADLRDGASDMSGGAALSAAIAALVLFGVFFSLMALRVPVAFALGLACLPVMLIEPRLSPMILFNETFKSYNSFILLAVPFFLLTANLMNVGGITDRLVRLSRDLVGHLPGGLAQVNVVLSIFFAGISGSSTADAASQGKIFIEAQVKEGYDLSFSVAITAVSAVLAVIIPPSILMIVWGGTLSVSIGALFLAGIIPGLLLGGVADGDRARLREDAQLPEVSARVDEGGVQRHRRRHPGADDAGDHHRRQDLRLVHRHRVGGDRGALRGDAVDLRLPRDERQAAARALLDTGQLAAVALFCVGTASAFGWLLAYYQIPKALLAGVGSWGMGITGTGFFIAFCFLVVGCFLDAIPAIIIVGTILEPLARSVNMDPGPLRDGRHHLAGLRAGHAAVRPVPDDLLRHRQGAAHLRDQGRDDHAHADARRARALHHVARPHPVPAADGLAGIPEVAGTPPGGGGRSRRRGAVAAG